jgi:nucleotidyltransferase substrate binding protein (TIGR01987 family)
MDLTQRTTARFKKAVASLDRALGLKPLPDNVDQDSVLLRFELSAELMPKALKRVLEEYGTKESLPKNIVRAALEAKIVTPENAETLIVIIDERNRMVHDYSENFATRLADDVRSTYAPALRDLADKW